MTDVSSKPTLVEMQTWRDTLMGEFGALHKRMREEEKLYFQAFDQETLGAGKAVKTGSAPSDADSAIDSIVPTDVLVRVKPVRGGRKKYEDQADKLRRFGLALVNSWRKKRDLFRKIAADMAIRRVGVARVLFDDSVWPKMPVDLPGEDEDADDWEVAHRRRNPIVLERRNPMHCAWRETDDGTMLAFCEHYQTTVFEARISLGAHQATSGLLRSREPNELVTIDDIWVGPWRCVLLDDAPVFPGRGESRGILPHGYAEIPYVVMPFREVAFDETEETYRGMLTNASGLYPLESQVLAMQVEMLRWNAWRTFKGWTRDGRDLQILPGQYIEVDTRIGEYIELIEGDPIPDEVLQTAAVVDSYIQRNGVAQGPTTAQGTRSGQQLWAIQSMRQIKIESARQSLTTGVERMLMLASMIAESRLKNDRLTLPVPGKDKDGKDMGETTITPADINGYWDGWDVTFGKRLDPALLEQAKALSALAANNWMPLKTSWELSGLTEVPQDWEDSLMLQATDRLDFMIELAALERVKRFYGEGSWQYLMMKQRISQSHQQSRPMPGAPGMAGGGTMQPPSMKGPVATGLQTAMTPQKSARPTGRTPAPRTPGGGAGGPPGGGGGGGGPVGGM